MIRQIGLRNIRLFGNEGYSFDLPALSIFCGTNSSGKSTILKTLSLLRQSQGLYETYGTRPGMLRLTGSEVDLGNYQSFVSYGRVDKSIEIALTVRDRMPARIARFSDVPQRLIGSRQQIEYALKVTFSFKAFTSATETDEAGRISTMAPLGVLHKADFRLFVGNSQIASWLVKRSSSRSGSYRIYLSSSQIGKGDRSPAAAQNNVSERPSSGVFETSLEGLLPSHLISKERGVGDTRQGEPRELPPLHRAVLNRFTRALRRISYLAPLRAAAKRYYLTNYDVAADLDPRGDFLPYILGGIIEEPKVSTVPPKGKTTMDGLSLTEALNAWLSYLRTGKAFNRKSVRSELEVSTSKGTLVEIKLKGLTGDMKHSIADSGFGYSQILPILVRGLIAPKNSTLVIEQPELHLNPALQVRLADFFISLVRADKQVIVETHSEHIVNAIRVRTAEEKGGFLANNSKIYFLDVERGKPVTHEMSIQPDGTVPRWPFHFFGEATTLTGELLRAQKRFITN